MSIEHMPWGKLLALSLIFSVSFSGCGLFEGETQVEDEPENEIVEDPWEPPYSLCEDNQWTCSNPTPEVRQSSQALEDMVEEMVDSGASAEEVVAAVEATGHNVTLAGGRNLLYWVNGGVPRAISYIPELIPDPEFERDEPVIGSIESLLGEFEELEALKSESASTRSQGLSAHGIHQGFERNSKRALLMLGEDINDDFVEHSNFVRATYEAQSDYSKGEIVYQGPNDITLASLRNWRDYDVIHLLLHGIQKFKDRVGRSTSFLTVPRLYMNDELLAGKPFDTPRTQEEWDAIADYDCDKLIGKLGAKGYQTKGLVCFRLKKWVNVEGESERVLQKFRAIGLTFEWLAQPHLNNAPLRNMLLYFDSCQLGKDLSLSDYDAIAAEGTTILSWNETLHVQHALVAAKLVYEQLFIHGRDIERALEVIGLGPLTETDYLSAHPVLWSFDDSSTRAIEVVRLFDPKRGIEAHSENITLVPKSSNDSDKLDMLEVDAGVWGVDGAKLDAYEIGIFAATEDGVPVGDVLEPGWVSLTNETARLVDPELELWVLDLGEVITPFDMRERSEINLTVVARLHEGGESRWSYRVELDHPGCPSGYVTIDGLTSKRANSTAFTGFGLNSFTLSRSAFDPFENPIMDGSPSGSFFVRGALPSQQQGSVGVDGVEGSVGFSLDEYQGSGVINVVFGEGVEDEDGELPRPNTTIRLLGDTNAYEGTIEGVGMVSQQGVPGTRRSSFSIEFRTSDISDPRTPTSCYVYPEGRR